MYKLQCMLFVTVLFVQAKAHSSLEELKDYYVQTLMDCSKIHLITLDDIEMLKNKQMPDNINAKCLFACAYKKANIMTRDGELSVTGVTEMAAKYLSHDPAKMAKAMDFINSCKDVNKIPVSDGNKGCERAALMFQCSVEKGPQFGF